MGYAIDLTDRGAPPGWQRVRLRDVVGPTRPRIAPDPASDVPFVGMDGIEPNGMKVVPTGRFGDMKSAAAAFKKRDVLYGRLRSYLNKVAVADFDGAASAEFIVFTESDHIDPHFLAFLLHSKRFVQFASSLGTGDRPRVDVDQIGAFEFLLPPMAQQHRVVARIEELFGEIDAGEQELAAAKADLARYRRAVPKAAVAGELTKDWRVSNKPTEIGADLLARILKARRDRRAINEPVCPDVSQLPELPQGWVWSSLDQLAVDGPTNGYSPKASAGASGTWSLKLTATTSGWFRSDPAALKRLDEIVEPDSKYWLQPNDLLLQRGNTIEYVGVAAIYEGPPNTFVYPDLMMRVRLVDNRLLRWVWRCINAPYARNWIAKRATGTAGTMPKINGEVVRAIPIPLPPILEAQRIAERIDLSVAASDEMSAAIEAAEADSARARAGILAAAFSGKLASGDARVKASRAA